MDEVISELELALVTCRAHIAQQTNDNQLLSSLIEAASKLDQALKLLKSHL